MYHPVHRILDGLSALVYYYAEIGATAKAPAIRTMKYGIIMGYVTIVGAYLTVSITGYWAFGNQ